MKETLIGLATLILKHPELKEKKDYEIYNLWFSKHECNVKNMDELKLILKYINNLKTVPPVLLEDCFSEN